MSVATLTPYMLATSQYLVVAPNSKTFEIFRNLCGGRDHDRGVFECNYLFLYPSPFAIPGWNYYENIATIGKDADWETAFGKFKMIFTMRKELECLFKMEKKFEEKKRLVIVLNSAGFTHFFCKILETTLDF